VKNLRAIVAGQMNLNGAKNLLHANVENILEIEPTFLSAMEELAAGPSAELSPAKLTDLAAGAADLFIRRIYAVNQYIQIREQERREVEKIYLDSWKRLLHSKDVAGTLRNYHYPRIKAFIERAYPSAFADALRSRETLNRVPCSEYSADLQLDLLRIDLSQIMEPVLDIGCGAHANLVTYLRAAGVDAYGCDRVLSVHRPYLVAVDWFTFELSSGRWGAILSNLSFASHFSYAQQYDRERVPRYVGLFHRVLLSLAPGGSFTFAPNVGELEARTDLKAHRIEKWPLAAGYGATRITRAAP